jgi:hypothetical protein
MREFEKAYMMRMYTGKIATRKWPDDWSLWDAIDWMKRWNNEGLH